MHIGFLTRPFGRDAGFAEIAEWASKKGFAALEVNSGPKGHLRPSDVLRDDGKEVRRILDSTGIRISGLEYYSRMHDRYAEDMKELIFAAEALDTMVCVFAGFPADGKTKMQTIREDLPEVMAPLAEDAGARGVKIAFENWAQTNLQHLDHFRAVCDVLPHPNVGFNFDPSHLFWQQIDYLAAVEEFGDRIFHTHAKDVAVRGERLARLGVLESGWWEFVIPGYGGIDWGAWLNRLRAVKYDGVVCIEHEDPHFGGKEGLERGRIFLSTLV